MSNLFNTLTHNLRRALASRGIELSLGHAHQLLAALHGYPSKAARDAVERKPEAPDLDVNWLVDTNQLASRADTLGLQLDLPELVVCLADASRELSGPRVYSSAVTLLEMTKYQVERALLSDIWVSNKLRDEARSGPYAVEVTPLGTIPTPLPQTGQDIRLLFSCAVQDEKDLFEDSPGFAISLTVEARLTMLDRRLISAPAIRILETALGKARVDIGLSSAEAGQYVNLSKQAWEALERGRYAGTQILIDAHDLFFSKLARLQKAPHHHDAQSDVEPLVAVFDAAQGTAPVDVVGADNFLGLEDARDGRKVIKSLAIDVRTRRIYVHRQGFDPAANRHVLKFAQRHLVTP
ncbi:hypothetical protein [Duganella vulcania]|uniref:Uncharacterized protein n=1 Tax=Duganella vulcania TaxID=2692166 RepID=A0A845GHT8_9BURK|nr:hypothetical protein [Duganella vulcania]MYM92239.1 hypothetical protein [Duganella vulcania]